MGRPKGSKNKTNSGQRTKADDDVENSLNTPKHYTNIVTPKPLRQYTIPSGLDQVGQILYKIKIYIVKLSGRSYYFK